MAPGSEATVVLTPHSFGWPYGAETFPWDGCPGDFLDAFLDLIDREASTRAVFHLQTLKLLELLKQPREVALWRVFSGGVTGPRPSLGVVAVHGVALGWRYVVGSAPSVLLIHAQCVGPALRCSRGTLNFD